MNKEEFKQKLDEWQASAYALMQKRLAEGWTEDQFFEAIYGKAFMDNVKKDRKFWDEMKKLRSQ
jgi:hypothetical protein